MPAGRPSKYSEELASRICDALVDGKHIYLIAKEEWAPSRPTINAWMRQHPEFLAKVSEARTIGSHALVEQAFEIADEDEDDSSVKVARANTKIGIRKWGAAKYNTPAYGDKTSIDAKVENTGTPSDIDLMELGRKMLFALRLSDEAAARVKAQEEDDA